MLHRDEVGVEGSEMFLLLRLCCVRVQQGVELVGLSVACHGRLRAAVSVLPQRLLLLGRSRGSPCVGCQQVRPLGEDW